MCALCVCACVHCVCVCYVCMCVSWCCGCVMFIAPHLSPHPPSHPQAWLKPGGQLLLSDYCHGNHQIMEPLISFIESEGLQPVGVVTWTEVGGGVSLPPVHTLSLPFSYSPLVPSAQPPVCINTHTYTQTHHTIYTAHAHISHTYRTSHMHTHITTHTTSCQTHTYTQHTDTYHTHHTHTHTHTHTHDGTRLLHYIKLTKLV